MKKEIKNVNARQSIWHRTDLLGQYTVGAFLRDGNKVYLEILCEKKPQKIFINGKEYVEKL